MKRTNQQQKQWEAVFSKAATSPSRRDYERIERVIMASLGTDVLNGEPKLVDIHTKKAMVMFGIPESMVKSKHRLYAKQGNYMLLYTPCAPTERLEDVLGLHMTHPTHCPLCMAPISWECKAHLQEYLDGNGLHDS